MGKIDVGFMTYIATENQLLNEEKWIIETMKKIKRQRHSLEVEKLHIVSVISKHRMNCAGVVPNVNIPQQSKSTAKNINLDIPYVQDDEIEEELNLTVSNPFIQTDGIMDTEEYEEEDEDDYDIDINMFMHGEVNDKKK